VTGASIALLGFGLAITTFAGFLLGIHGIILTDDHTKAAQNRLTLVLAGAWLAGVIMTILGAR